MDLDKLYSLICDIADDNENVDNVLIQISEKSKSHSHLSHYCSFNTFQCIITNKTLRYTCLCNARINDLLEGKRKSIECFANNVFISCLTH